MVDSEYQPPQFNVPGHVTDRPFPADKADRSTSVRRKGARLSWGVALVAAAAMVTAGTVYANNTDSVPDKSVSASERQLSMEELRSVLVPLAGELRELRAGRVRLAEPHPDRGLDPVR
jgi:hypothetical protein